VFSISILPILATALQKIIHSFGCNSWGQSFYPGRMGLGQKRHPSHGNDFLCCPAFIGDGDPPDNALSGFDPLICHQEIKIF
jgi:hypothetical protein